ncbi:MAG: FAD-dependent oxidoreductase [Burkholderiales bacterium]|nr:FAD-dependent oxidoreductase [Burkholderiales bacterium]
MKWSKFRTPIAAIFILLVVVGIVFKTGWGTLSSFGYDKIAEICPLGSLEAMIASHTLIPRALLGLLIFALIVIALGRFFCGWLCPVPVIRRIFGKDNVKAYSADEDSDKGSPVTSKVEETPVTEAIPLGGPIPVAKVIPMAPALGTGPGLATAFAASVPMASGTPEVLPRLKSGKPQNENQKLKKAQKLQASTPYIILGGALLSTAIFSFPVFCLICPVGLSFALILSVWHLFVFNEPSLTILLFLGLLALEIFVLRKWCHAFCPLGALMSLISRFNFSFRPTVDKRACYKSTDGFNCTKCSSVCTEGIDLHKSPSNGLLSRCLKCHKCADVCPTHAISFPFFTGKLQKKAKAPAKYAPVLRKDPPKLDAAHRIEFKEFVEQYDAKTVQEQASRCMACGECVEACPLNNPIPQWLSEAAQGNFRQAGDLLFGPGSLPEFCSRVCPQEKLCESACPLTAKGGAIPIGPMSKFVATKYLKAGLRPKHKVLRNAPHIAIIGAGPGGLACADALTKEGYKVTVFDDHPMIGGLLTYGIPSFKLDKKLIASRLRYYKKLGTELKLNTTVGKDVSFADLLKDYDAVYISAGAKQPIPLNLPGADNKQVINSADYLSHIAEQELADSKHAPADAMTKGKKVVVLGAGDTAMDCLRSALRLGATEATCICRKPESGLRASKREVNYAKEEGVKFIFESTASELVIDDGTLTGLVIETPEGKRQIPADLIVVAYGAKPLKTDWMVEAGISFGSHDELLTGVNILPGETTNDKVFAGGDAVRGSNLVVNAVKDGRTAAKSITEYLKKIGRLDAKQKKQNGK